MTSTVLSIVKKVNMHFGYNSFNLRNAGVNIIKSPTPPRFQSVYAYRSNLYHPHNYFSYFSPMDIPSLN